MYQKRKSKSKRRVRPAVVIVALVLLAGGVAVALDVADVIDLPFIDRSETSEDDQTINFDPPTDEEKASGNDKKEELTGQDSVKDPQQNDTTETTLQDGAQVAIVDANQYGQEVEVRAFVSNIIADGTCTITFELGNDTLTKTVDAIADATTTPCINLVVPRSEFAQAGNWTVTVQYQNDTIKGSASSTINIQ